MFRALCAHHQEVKIVLYSIWYRHTCRWPSGAQVERSWLIAKITKMYVFNLTFRGPCIVIYYYKKNQQDALISQFYFGTELYMFHPDLASKQSAKLYDKYLLMYIQY